MSSLKIKSDRAYVPGTSRPVQTFSNFGTIRESRFVNNGSFSKSTLPPSKCGDDCNNIPVEIIDNITKLAGDPSNFHVLGFTVPRPSQSLDSINTDSNKLQNDHRFIPTKFMSGMKPPHVVTMQSLGREGIANFSAGGPRTDPVSKSSHHKSSFFTYNCQQLILKFRHVESCWRKLNQFHSARDLNRLDPKAVMSSDVSSKVSSAFNNCSTVGPRCDVRLRDRDYSTIANTSRDFTYLRKVRQKNNMSMVLNNCKIQPTKSSQYLKRVQSQNNISTLQSETIQRNSNGGATCQRIFIVRHGERVDSTFGINWLDVVFDSKGKYRRVNINLPRVIPRRRNAKDFLFDPPLTEVGLVHSRLVGEELDACGTHIKHCYSSPALRCIQTATKILEGMNRSDIPIRIEPCLFEFLKWHPVMPMKSPFMNMEELKNNGFHIDTSYKTIYPLESLRKDEDEAMFYTRSHTVMQQIIRNHEISKINLNATKDMGETSSNDNEDDQYKPENILIVAHAPTLEVATRQLTGGNPRVADLKFLVRQIPYLSIQTVERQSDNTWKLRRPPIPPMKHSAVEPFDWRYMR